MTGETPRVRVPDRCYLTAPAHQWLVHEPEPLRSGLAGRRVSGELADRFTAILSELRAMDDLAGGGTVLPLAQQHFGVVAELLGQASYDEPTDRRFHVVLAELGQFCGWCGYDAGQPALASATTSRPCARRTSADDRPLGAHILSCLAHASVEPREEDPPWLHWVCQADITSSAGIIGWQYLLRLGQADRTAALIEEGIAFFDESFVRDRQHASICLADALAQPGKQRDLDAAASRGMEAIRLAEYLDSTLTADLLRDLCRQMTPHAKVPVVGDFLSQARDLVQV